MGDYQTRRMQVRYRNQATGISALLHTLKESAPTVERTLAAILENNENANSSVTVPFALCGYISRAGQDKLRPE